MAFPQGRLKALLHKAKYVQYFHRIFEKKTVVLVISSMRSGSTLLKSLLAQAPDVSYLPEVNFQNYKHKDYVKAKIQCKEKIIVWKKPAWYTDIPSYPVIPKIPNIKKIILIRDAYETIESINLMNKEIHPELVKKWDNNALLNNYWIPLYQGIINKKMLDSPDTTLIRYEDLISEPISSTRKLFHFIGSKQKEGVDSYNKPSHYEWKWGNDDGGELIRSLKVQKLDKPKNDLKLLSLIESSQELLEVKKSFGY